jgi:hypothetical protein
VSDVRETSGVTIPQSVLLAVLLTAVTAMGTGGYYMGRQSSQLEVLDSYKKSNDARLAIDEAAIAAGTTASNEVNTRLTRIETQLDFIIKSNSGNVRK